MRIPTINAGKEEIARPSPRRYDENPALVRDGIPIGMPGLSSRTSGRSMPRSIIRAQLGPLAHSYTGSATEHRKLPTERPSPKPVLYPGHTVENAFWKIKQVSRLDNLQIRRAH